MLTQSSGELPFSGTDRFALEERIGEGGMGIVYRAHDRERDALVALKTLSRVSAKDIYQFKREFRALADLAHPNVVNLYELVSHRDHWFFTMELVDGAPLNLAMWSTGGGFVDPSRSGVRPALHSPTAATVDVAALQALSAETTADSSSSPVALEECPRALGLGDTIPAPPGSTRDGAASSLPMTPCRDIPRLRRTLRQLVEGVAAVHGAGKLHCDLKPSNVLVTPRGRVVVLDFGIVTDLAAEAHLGAEVQGPAGTPAYMAPEQASSDTLTPAADWYALGVMLFEVLTGVLPIDGNVLSLLAAKQHAVSRRPSTLVRGVPDDLDALTMDLLQVSPDARPTGAQILRRLSSAEPLTGGAIEIAGDGPRPLPFVGREGELDALRGAYERAADRTVAVLVRGRSGMGKSRLVERFLEERRRTRDTLVLSARCFEREAVPYKVFDSLVDTLARYLLSLPMRQAQALLPPLVHEVAVVFPVLRAVAAVDASAPAREPDLDPHERRQRAFDALRGLLCRLAASRRVVIHLDDVHWGDVDSASLLDALFTGPSSPPLLVVLSHRSDLSVASEFLRASRVLSQPASAGVDVRVIEVEELDDRDARELAYQLLDGPGSERSPASAPERRRAQAGRVAHEGRGNPLFIAELVQYASERHADSEDADREIGTLDEVLRARIAELPAEARELLTSLSVAGAPLDQTVALRAAGISAGDWAAPSLLRARRLVTSRADGGDYRLSPAHDRIREASLAALDGPRLRAHHGRLAHALAATGRADPETLLVHFRAAGDQQRAAGYAARAADAASRGLAFLRAAQLYELAIELSPSEPGLDLRAKLGEALGRAGRGGAAGRAYLRAATFGAGVVKTRMRRLAAEQFLRGGHEAEGLSALREVLREVDLPYPESPARALASLVYRRARTNLVHLRDPERSLPLVRTRALSEPELERMDAAYTAFIGLTLTDAIRGAAFGGQFLALALESGDPKRISRALAIESSVTAMPGPRARDRASSLVRAAGALAARTEDPHTLAMARLCASYVSFFFGEWREARQRFADTERLLREDCVGVAYELASCQVGWLNTSILLGELGEAAHKVPAILREARERGDRYAPMQMTYAATVALITQDDVEGAREVSTRDVPAWTSDRYTISHWASLTSAVSVDRYVGDGRAAWARFEREWHALRRCMLMRVQAIRVFAHFERAMSAVSAAESGGDASALLPVAERHGGSLTREGVAYARGFGFLVSASVRAARGDREGALQALGGATAATERAELGYIGACARARRGQLLGGDCGAELVRDATEYLRASGIVDVARCLSLSAPGFSSLTDR